MITAHSILQPPPPPLLSPQKSNCLTFFIGKKKALPYLLPTKKMEFGIARQRKL